MRKVLLGAWLFVPLAAGAYHFGPGQDQLRLDEADSLISEAADHARKAREVALEKGDDAAVPHWFEAEAAYAKALELLPSTKVEETRAVRLERAKAQMFVSKLPAARTDLESLVNEMAADPNADPKVLADARESLATSQYYMTWLMRLEGAPKEEWEPEIEAARQTFKVLACAAEEDGDSMSASRGRDNLESAIRLARLDLSDLQGLPLPSQ